MGYFAIYGMIALWGILSTLSMSEYFEYAKELKGLDLLIFILVFAVGGPIFAANQVLTMILGLILPEGWDDDDDDFK